MYLINAPAGTADKDMDAFKAKMAGLLGLDTKEIVVLPAGVTVTACSVPGPAGTKVVKGPATSAEITRLCKQLHEEEDGVHPHAETHEETVKLLMEVGEPAVPELRKWAATGHGPGNKRCTDLADQLEGKKHKKTEHEPVKDVKKDK